MKRFLFFSGLLLAYTTLFGQVVKISHTYYTIYFDQARKLPLYTYYLLTKEHLVNRVNRSGFVGDGSIDLSLQTATKKYSKGNGPLAQRVDAGHLSPDDDFRFEEQAEKEAMVFTNAAPQQANFNRGPWKAIEGKVKSICSETDSVKVWTGCIYYNSLKINGVAKPHYFWKVIKYRDGKIEWLGENKYLPGRRQEQLVVPDGEIERRTGLVFD